MKHFLSIILTAALLCAGLAFPASAQPAEAAPKALRFTQEGSFKIIQLTDLHMNFLGSRIVRDFILDLAESERPDLFVLTGDNIADSGSKFGKAETRRSLVRKSIDSYMDVFDEVYDLYGIPVTMVLGNHDSEHLADVVDRKEHFEIYASHRSFIGAATDADGGTVGEHGPHYGTHSLVINGRAGAEPVFNLWFFDSGGYDERGGYDGVQKPQIDWFNETNEALGRLPSLAFQHIVVPEIFDLLPQAQPGGKSSYTRKFYQYNAPGCGEENLVLADGKPAEIEKTVSAALPEGIEGELNEEPCPGMFNHGQYAALCEAGNVRALFFGHEHVNTFELRLQDGTDLVNTPGTGFRTYGKAKLRGARVITLDDGDLDSYETDVIFYRDYYPGLLRRARLNLFEGLRSWASFVDFISFRPIFWLEKRFGKQAQS